MRLKWVVKVLIQQNLLITLNKSLCQLQIDGLCYHNACTPHGIQSTEPQEKTER